MLNDMSPSDYRALKVFDAVAKCGGFAKAQETLGVGQSTISLQISALEDRLGYRLCDRGRGGFRLTERGQVFLDAYSRLQRATELFAATASGLSERIVGTLRLGLLDHTATDERFSTVELIRTFHHRAPEVRIEIVQDVQSKLREMIGSQQLDLAIGAFPQSDSAFDVEDLYSERQYIHCGIEHPMFGTPTADISLETLETFAWVQRGYSLLPKGGFPIAIGNAPATAANLEAVATLLQSTPLVGYLPGHFAQRFVRSKNLRRLTSRFSVRYDITLLSRSGRRDTAAMRVFRELARAQAAVRRKTEA